MTAAQRHAIESRSQKDRALAILPRGCCFQSTEVRVRKGATIVSIVAEIQNILSAKERRINFFDDNNFRHVKDSLDAAILSAKLGCNLPRKSAELLTKNANYGRKVWGMKHQENCLTLFDINGIHFT